MSQPLPQNTATSTQGVGYNIQQNIQQKANISNLSNSYPTHIQQNTENEAEELEEEEENIQLPQPLSCGTYELDVKKATEKESANVQYSMPTASLISAIKSKKSALSMLYKARNANNMDRVEELGRKIAVIDAEITRISAQMKVKNLQKFVKENMEA